MQVYVDDMLVKSIQEDDDLGDLKETFDTFRSYNMKLNPNKCAFFAPSKTVREVQSLNGKTATLNRFVLKVTDKCMLFFRTLKKSFEWTTEC